MRSLVLSLIVISLALLPACSNPDSRIAGNRSAFDKFPADVQQKIRAGQVDIGFTPEMVRLALGEPSRKFTRKTGAGDSEVWGFRAAGPRFSFGLGVGTGGRHSSVGGDIEMSSGGYDPEENIQVEFNEGRVSAIDYLKRS